MALKGVFRKGVNEGFDLREEASSADVADAEFLNGSHELLITEPGIHANDDRDVLVVVGPDESNGMLDHFGRRVPVVGVLISAPEYGINNESAPGHLERLESKDFLVSRLDSVALGGVIIVHDHGVEAEDDDSRFSDLEPPEKKLKEESAEQEYPGPGKPLEKAFH